MKINRTIERNCNVFLGVFSIGLIVPSYIYDIPELVVVFLVVSMLSFYYAMEATKELREGKE